MWTSRFWLCKSPTGVDMCSRTIARYMYRQFPSLAIVRFAFVIVKRHTKGFVILEPTGIWNTADIKRRCTCAIYFVNLSQASILFWRVNSEVDSICVKRANHNIIREANSTLVECNKVMLQCTYVCHNIHILQVSCCSYQLPLLVLAVTQRSFYLVENWHWFLLLLCKE